MNSLKNTKGKRFKYNKKYNILLAIAAVIIVIYILYAIIKLIQSPTDTFIIKYGKVSMEEQAIGYIIRSEVIAKGNNYQNGLIQIKSEGEKTAVGEAIFRYYNSNEEEIINQINEVDLKINEAMENQTGIFSSDIKSLEKQIEQTIDGIQDFTDTEKIREYKNDINTYLTKKSKIAGETSKSGSYIKQLYEERSSYEAKLSASAEYIYAPMGGVVSYRIDGLENILTPSDFTTINKSLLEGLNIKTGQIIATNNEEGKVINNFECYIATVMGTDNAINSKEGQNVKIRLSSQDEVDAKIVYKAQEDNGEVLLVFKITKKVEDLISYRKISFDVIWWSDTGLKVPNSSILHDENNNSFIIRNRAGYLDKIMIKELRTTKNYTIVENYEIQDLQEKGYTDEEIRKMKNVMVYDEIISNPDKSMLQ